jgi:hypothetical protein
MTPCSLVVTQLQLVSGYMKSQQRRQPLLPKLLPIHDFFGGKMLN